MQIRLVLSLIAALALSACASTRAPQSEQAAAAERARCEDVLKMGSGMTHDHTREKTGHQSQMAADHDHCRAVLAR